MDQGIVAVLFLPAVPGATQAGLIMIWQKDKVSSGTRTQELCQNGPLVRPSNLECKDALSVQNR